MPSVNPELVTLLLSDFEAAQCHALRLPLLIGQEAVAAMGRQVAGPARRALAGVAEPARTLIACFMVGDEVAAESLAAALPSLGLAGARELGIIELDECSGGRARSLVAIRPWLTQSAGRPVSWWVVSDHDELSSVIPLPADHVLGVGGAGKTLTALLPQQRVESALDVGCGCGVISLQLAQVADRVVATDISPRALWCTELTCALNGVTTVETRLGSLLEPVAGERFDLIASNPPFVITPRITGQSSLEYRDGGLVGDQIVQRLVREIPEQLNPAGLAVMLGNWEYHGGDGDDRGLGRVLDWAGEHGCWVIERERLSPASYAELWVRDGGTLPSSAVGGALVASWLDDFAERQVSQIGLGWVLLSNCGPKRAERVMNPVDLGRAGLGSQLAAMFEAMAAVADLDDDEVGALRLTTAPDVVEVRHLRPGSPDPVVIELRQGGGLARTIRADTGLAALVGALDGEYDVASLIAAIAGILEVDGEALAAELLPQVRELLVTGMVTVTRRPTSSH